MSQVLQEAAAAVCTAQRARVRPEEEARNAPPSSSIRKNSPSRSDGPEEETRNRPEPGGEDLDREAWKHRDGADRRQDPARPSPPPANPD